MPEKEIISKVRGDPYFAKLFETLSFSGPCHRIDIGISHLLDIEFEYHDEDNNEEDLDEGNYTCPWARYSEELLPSELDYSACPLEMFI